MTFADLFHGITEEDLDRVRKAIRDQEDINRRLSAGQREMLSIFRKELREAFREVVREVRKGNLQT